MAEFAPALFLLFFCAMFPAIDFIGIGLSYSACMSLTDLQLREAVKVPRSEAMSPSGGVQTIIPNNWKATVMGGMSSLIDIPQTQVTYTPGVGNVYVTVSTTFNIHPVVAIPIFPQVPGLDAPIVTTISHTRVLENPAFAGQ